jgi:hypothetical protein
MFLLFPEREIYSSCAVECVDRTYSDDKQKNRPDKSATV